MTPADLRALAADHAYIRHHPHEVAEALTAAADAIEAATLAERERCARLCERVVNEAELGRGHAKGAAMCIELVRGKA